MNRFALLSWLLLSLMLFASCIANGELETGIRQSENTDSQTAIEAGANQESTEEAPMVQDDSAESKDESQASIDIVPGELPIFDTHVHYSQAAWDRFPPEEVIAKMERSSVPRALVSSSPDDGTLMLYELDPDRIVPSLRPYHGDATSSNWFRQDFVVPYLTERLEQPVYVGIGEFHVHTHGDVNLPIVRETIQMAIERGLYLQIHSDAQTIRAVFQAEPTAKILWAHLDSQSRPTWSLNCWMSMGIYGPTSPFVNSRLRRKGCWIRRGVTYSSATPNAS